MRCPRARMVNSQTEEPLGEQRRLTSLQTIVANAPPSTGRPASSCPSDLQSALPGRVEAKRHSRSLDTLRPLVHSPQCPSPSTFSPESLTTDDTALFSLSFANAVVTRSTMLIPSAIFAVCLTFTGRSEGKALRQQTWEYQPGPAWYQAPKPAPAPYPQTSYPQANSWNNNNNAQKPSESLTNNLIPQLPNRPGEEGFQPSIEEQRVAGDFISALKNVFNKFSSNLDHSGIHEDVSQMTSQLQQTWDELKRGLTRSWETVKTSAQDSVAPYSGQMGAHLEKLFNKAQQMVVTSD